MARTKRQEAIRRRRIFLTSAFAVLAMLIAGVVALVYFMGDAIKNNDASSSKPSSQSEPSSSENSSSDTPSGPEMVQIGEFTLDADFSCLMLVNGDNPLPENYDSEVRESLVTVDKQYRNNDYVTQIHKDVYPYITAMVATAQSEGVDLRVWSPFRSYAIQNDLFQKQVNRMKERGYTGTAAEDKAATVVARPGTSEHNTGVCADFNMADDSFENTQMYTWMKENAENFGFVMRYEESKQDITGVIHESWHWRFVGIKHAKEMNKLGMCLEEYVEYLEKE